MNGSLAAANAGLFAVEDRQGYFSGPQQVKSLGSGVLTRSPSPSSGAAALQITIQVGPRSCLRDEKHRPVPGRDGTD
jgi:hypothetical protein